MAAVDAAAPPQRARKASSKPVLVASRKAIRRWPVMLPLDPREPTYAILADIERRLPTLRVPLLWLQATPGAITTPARIQWLTENVPHIRIRHVGRGAHFIQEEVPEAIARELGAWLATLQ
jgi:pimeloyl-ACP methyl ester carboxylesterase